MKIQLHIRAVVSVAKEYKKFTDRSRETRLEVKYALLKNQIFTTDLGSHAL